MKVVFLADFFVEDVTGGAEKNDDVLVRWLQDNNLLFRKIRCSELDIDFLLNNKDKIYIISNFVTLNHEHKACLYANEIKYIIYEHDYKFDKTRNPLLYKECLIPSTNICNVNFYKKAFKVVTLSTLHRDIFEKNLRYKDNIVNINCSLFDEKTLNYLYELREERKKQNWVNDITGIIDSQNPIKCTKEAVSFAKDRDIKYKLFKDSDYLSFLKKMSRFEKIIIFSGHPEPTPRTAVEAKLLGLKIICNKKNIGVANEYWFGMDGEDLFSEIRKIREYAFNMFREFIDEN